MEELVRQVPAWRRASLVVEPLPGGITNRNYVVTVDDHRYVVRVPGERTELLGIDRIGEVEATSRAADLGIGPAVFGKLPGTGTLITEFVPGSQLDNYALTTHLEGVVELVHRFHHGGRLRSSFPVHRVVEWHARDAGAHGVMPPSSYERLHQHSRRIEAAFAAAPSAPVACHNDLLPANVLVGDDRVWLLDYEYAGMNDAFFDLANLSVNSSLGDADDERLLRLYFGDVSASRWARLQLMKCMSEFREGMWAVVQQAISTLDTDFVAYADERLTRCESLAARIEFASWLDDAARHPA
ncbi:MAG: choline kinase family protein [Ilumatobacteraceae bacterium]